MMPQILVLNFVLVLPIVSVAILAVQCGKSKSEATVVEISAREQWYLDRSEKEQSFQGTLRKRKAPLGPGARGGLNFTLAAKGAEYPVYTGGADEKLKPFVRRFVSVRAKLVDLTKEGF